MKKVTLNNVVNKLELGWGIEKRRLYRPGDAWRKYILLNDILFCLSDGSHILIEKGFKWDLSSVPQIFWCILPPDGDWEIAALIHDYLYSRRLGSRKQADKEMLKWSMILHRTKSTISLRHTDNYIRYYGVRLFGYFAWKND